MCPVSCLLPPVFAGPAFGSLPHRGSLPLDEPDRDPRRGCWPDGKDLLQRGGCLQKARNKTRSLQRRYPQHWSGGQRDGHEKEEVGLAKIQGQGVLRPGFKDTFLCPCELSGPGKADCTWVRTKTGGDQTWAGLATDCHRGLPRWQC